MKVLSKSNLARRQKRGSNMKKKLDGIVGGGRVFLAAIMENIAC
jgi:hypothetical protein